MRTRTLVAALVLAAAVGACSRQGDPAPDAVPEDEQRSSEMLPQGGTDTEPVASPVEMHAPPPAPPQPRQQERAPARPASRGPRYAGEAAVPSQHTAHAAATSVAAAAETETPAAVAVGGGSGKPNVVAAEGPVPDPYGRPGAVIIRGGTPGWDDDCALHPRVVNVGGLIGIGGSLAAMPGFGEASVGGALINDLSPPRGTLINDRGPAQPTLGSDPVARGMPEFNSPDPRGRRAGSGTGMPVGRSGGMRRPGGIR